MNRAWIGAGLLSALCACVTHDSTSGDPLQQADRLTVAKVQGEIKVGLSSAEVVEILGSPNIITTDSQRRERWVYDRVSSDRYYTERSTYGTLLIIGGSEGDGASRSRQRTLTILIDFDGEGRVRDYDYNYTQF